MAGIVVPVSKDTFKIKVADAFVSIANMESLEISFDGNVETWNAIENGGYQSALKTGLAVSLSSDIKRTYGDAGNDSIADTMFEVGEEANREFEITLSNEDKITFTAVVNVESLGGATTDVEAMSVSFTVIGKPEYTKHV